MKAPSLDRLRGFVDYDPMTGVFTRKTNTRNGRGVIGDVTGIAIGAGGYSMLCMDSVSYLSHRMAWFHFYGEMPKMEIDHINGIKTDYRISNLRDVTRQVNAQNKRFGYRKETHTKRKYSKYLGVSEGHSPNTWKASISVDGNSHKLGLFGTEIEARDAYLAAKVKLHKGYVV